jgi:lipoate synthase
MLALRLRLTLEFYKNMVGKTVKNGGMVSCEEKNCPFSGHCASSSKASGQ